MNKNQLYDVTAEEDVHTRDSYHYLMNQIKLRSQLQAFKDEELAFLGFRRLFVLAEREYEAQLLKTPSSEDAAHLDLETFNID